MGSCLLVQKGSKQKAAPVLNPSYPRNSIVFKGDSVNFSVIIDTPGYPENYTYTWYKDGSTIAGNNSPVLSQTNLTAVGTSSYYCVVSNEVGSATSRTATLTVKSPAISYTYSGEHEYIVDEDSDAAYNWRLKLKSSGVLNITDFGKAGQNIDVFCVGGGGSAGVGWYNGYYGKGASGGFTATEKNVAVKTGVNYTCSIGSGGQANWSTGGVTDAFSVLSVEGGERTKGGSGGGAYGNYIHRNGGSDGSDGEQADNATAGQDNADSAGLGQHTTTREFGEITGDLYAGGGGNGTSDTTRGMGGAGGGGNGAMSLNSVPAEDGSPNTGGGGGGCWLNVNGAYGGKGGSGIIIIRNARNNSVFITTQPQNTTVSENANAIFTVIAVGSGLTYQWQFLPTNNNVWSNTSATGATTNSLTIQARSYRNNYKYRCVITDAAGNSIVSAAAILTVA